MKKPFFSLITPVYNIERLLSHTVQSALSQTFTDWEMILVDDGSPDNAGTLCDEYAKQDARIKVIHKQNEGLAQARNDGINKAGGQYFIILEGSDLFYDENTLQNIYNILSKNTVDIYFGRLQDVMEKGMEVTGVQAEYCIDGLFEKGGRQLFIELAQNDDVLALSSPVNKVFKTSFVKDNELWFYKGIYHDDDEWLPRTISLCDTAYFTKDIIYNALTWDGCFGQKATDKSLTKKAIDKMFIAEHCCEDIDRRFSEQDTEFKRRYYEYYVRIYITAITTLPQMSDKECINKVRNAFKQHNKVMSYALKSGVKNLKVIAVFCKVFGMRLAEKLITKRYGV